MVRIIEENRTPSIAQRFGRAFQSAGEALPTALESFDKAEKEKKLAIAKKTARVRPEIKSLLLLYNKNKAFDAEMIGNLESLSHKYLEQGFEPHEAVSAAYNDILSAPQGQNPPEEKSEFAKAFRGNPELLQKLGIASEKGVLSDIGTGLKKGGRTLVQLADFPFALAKESNYLGRGNFKTLTDLYDEATEGQGIPTNAVERIAGGIPLGIPGVAGTFAEEALHSSGAPESVQRAGGIVSFLAAHRIKIPELKNVLGKAKKTAEATGKSTEQVLAEAQQKSGVNLEQVAAGDKEAINAFKDNISEAHKVAGRVSETPKTFFNKKAAERQREAFGAKLPESPLEEYYNIKVRDIEKEASKRPETKAREQEIRTTLEPQEEKLFGELRNQKEQLNRIEKEIRTSGPENIDRLKTLKEFQTRKYQQDLEKLKDVQYEMKYGRARPTEAEIDAQIQKSIKEFEAEIQNPTEKSKKALDRQLELDKKYLDRAGKLIERGELPGEIRPDTFIKMKDKYLQGYKSAIQKARQEIAELKGERDGASLKKMEDNKKLVEALSNRVKRLEADIVNQTDNIKAMRALEKPSGAFYKNQIKSLKKDAALFEHDLFKQKMIRTRGELKTEKAFEEGAKEIRKGAKAAEEPTRENIKEAAEEAGKEESEFSKALRQVREEVKGVKDKVKNGTVTPNTENAFWKKSKLFAKGMGVASAIGAIQALSEESFGIKLNAAVMKRLASILGFTTLGTTTFSHSFVRGLFDNFQAEELKKLRGNVLEWNKYVKNMENKHGSAKVKRVLKIANESPK